MVFHRLVGLLILMILPGTGLSLAQQTPNPDQITDAPIRLGDVITDTLTERSFFDFYRFYADAGVVISVQMIAADGLAPLLGISGAGREIIARSDLDAQGNPLPDAEPNATIELEFVIPESGEYAIVPTRVGNADGTTTGSYTLIFTQADSGFVEEDTMQDVTFRCGEMIAITATTIDFVAGRSSDEFRISVYGFDGLHPVIRVVGGANGALRDCANDTQQMGGDQFILPGGETGSIATAAENRQNAAQLSLSGGELLDRVQVTIGAIEGTAGRYMLILEGLTLDEAEDMKLLSVRLGPLATTTEMQVYMLKSEVNRIDPLITWFGEDEDSHILCDDAGRGNCVTVPALIDSGVIFNDGTAILGDRFSAGLTLAPGNQDVMRLGFSSRARSATGDFAIILIGEVLPRSAID